MTLRRRTVIAGGTAALAFAALAGCQATMYRALETFGVEKRDLLAKRVGAARDAQDDAREQFTSALDRFRAVVQTEGGDLERTYDDLQSQYERSEASAKEVRERIDAVERVAEDLFAEWDKELGEYSDPGLRRESARLLATTRSRYGELLRAMRRAEGTMAPVLAVFHDQVLVLKHNLNAQAIGSLRRELGSIEQRTATLVREMQRSIAQADEFVASLRGRSPG